MSRLINVVFVLIIATCAPAFAGGLDTDAVRGAGFHNLSETQKAEIIQQIAQKNAAAQPPSLQQVVAVNNPQAVDQWLNIGERIGKMIGGAAKEVGMIVNEFVKTPVGMVAMGLIVWNYMGSMVVHVFGGLLVMIVGIGVTWYFARRSRKETITYDPERRDVFGRAVKVSHTKAEMDSGFVGGYMVAILVTVIFSLATMFTF